MGDISRHFDRNEFTCSCGCGFNTVDVTILEWICDIRNHFRKPVIIHSACRCIVRNRQVGSKDTSEHVKANAVDFHIPDVDPHDIAMYANELIGNDTGGIIIYDWGIHLDRRSIAYRDDKRT